MNTYVFSVSNRKSEYVLYLDADNEKQAQEKANDITKLRDKVVLIGTIKETLEQIAKGRPANIKHISVELSSLNEMNYTIKDTWLNGSNHPVYHVINNDSNNEYLLVNSSVPRLLNTNGTMGTVFNKAAVIEHIQSLL